MHTLGADSTVGLLLFDEPSAALDPVAEHGMILAWRSPFPINPPIQTFSRDSMNLGERGPWSSPLTASAT
jgi:hypothetical protein